MKIMKEVKEFALRGNVIDMAVGIIMGAAFTTVVKSVVDDVMMPPLGVLVGGMDFSDLKLTVKNPPMTEDGIIMVNPKTGKPFEPVNIRYGAFLNTLINLFIVSLAIFMLIKGINTLRRRFEAGEEAPAAGPPPPTRDQELLTEIRDLLKKRA